jgi:hypothetical protein
MKTYKVLFAENVPHYGVAEISAESDASALDAAAAYNISEVTNDGEWANSSCKRIVWMQDPDGNTVVEDSSLDDHFLRYGGEEERFLCDAAPQLLKALEASEPQLSAVVEMLRDENDRAVITLHGWQIQRVYETLRSAAIGMREAISAAREEQQ